MKEVELYKCAHTVVEKSLAIKPGEEFIVITDTLRTQSIGKALVSAATAIGSDSMLITYQARKRSPQEPPKVVAEAMKVANAVFSYTSTSLTHTSARVNAQKNGTRVMTAPKLTEDNFIRTMQADIDDVARLTNQVANTIKRAKKCRITTVNGTNLEMGLENEPLVIDGICHKPGELDLIPYGSNVIVPKEGTAHGRIVVDGSITSIGRITSPVILIIEGGKVTDIKGDSEADQLKKMLEELQDANVYNCPAEWGIGTNPKADLVGDDPTSEGERIYGWVHVSLGNNAAFPGGRVKAKIHLDAIIKDPQVELDGEVILKDRRFSL